MKRQRDPVHTVSIIAVFPEGTTSDGTTVLPFHANLIQAAISADAPVQPVAHAASSTLATGARSPVPGYIGDDTLLAVAGGYRLRPACRPS